MRHKFILLCLFAVLFLFGCQKDPASVSETTGEPLPQSFLSERLSVEKGNFSRANETGGGYFFEIETGYYYVHNRFLYYADKTDLTKWVPVCLDPKCSHDDNSASCTAEIPFGVYFSDNRFYFVADSNRYPHLYPGKPGTNIVMLCSMALDGTDVRFEHLFKECTTSAECGCNAVVFPDGYALFTSILQPDGTAKEMIFYKDSSVEKKLLERSRESMVAFASYRASITPGVKGDNAFVTGMLDPSLESLCLVLDGELKVVSVGGIPAVGGYLSGSVLRYYVQNEGYYDMELLTGERTLVAHAQLENSGVRSLAPNCIFESNLFQRETLVEPGAEAMRFFDGQAWHDVAIPEGFHPEDNSFPAPVALMSDCVMFRVIKHDGFYFYRMPLDAKNFTLEYCGMFPS